MSVINFSAGPAILPDSVIKKSAETILNYNNTGLSILEVSHRSKDFITTMNQAIQNAKDLFEVPDDYEVLFLTGGASTQFFMVPMNILNQDQTAGYVNTGEWATKAIKEAKAFGNIDVLASSEEDGFKHIPKGYTIPDSLRYLHLTSNNTIYGTQLHEFPDTPVPIVCDMSSDIFSRPIDIRRFGLIYAGAQKNMGPAGVTLVIVRKDLLDKVDRHIPSMLKYQTHIDKESMYNTPPVFPIYVSMLTMQWVKDNGGLKGMEQRNTEKAEALYAEIDRNPLFYGHSAVEDRSKMNVNFRLHDESRDQAFLDLCSSMNISGVKGYRTVGGFRASIYNAMDINGVNVLIEAMKEFEKIS
jgi:phosphoserine aminotransferase